MNYFIEKERVKLTVDTVFLHDFHDSHYAWLFTVGPVEKCAVAFEHCAHVVTR